jgi:DNA-binding winged helix-turn-helix (wHTH) protein
MQLPLAMPNLRREPIEDDGSPIVEHRARSTAIDATLEFGRFRVLLRQRRLLAEGVPVELGSRAFDILLVLIDADGALVTTDELRSRVWPCIVVAQDNLKVQICALRKALGEDHELIRTEHGRGYRFIAAVRVTGAAPECLWKAASPTDFAVVASRLVRLEVRLDEALSLLGTRRNCGRLRRRRWSVGHFDPARKKSAPPLSGRPRSMQRIGTISAAGNRARRASST